MKKLLFVFFVLTISSQLSAQITVKQVLGDWTYLVNTDQGALTGIIKITEKEGKLAANILSDDGNTFPVTKIEIKEGDILYFELVPEYDVIQISVKIDSTKFSGTVGTVEGAIPITGEKKE